MKVSMLSSGARAVSITLFGTGSGAAKFMSPGAAAWENERAKGLPLGEVILPPCGEGVRCLYGGIPLPLGPSP